MKQPNWPSPCLVGRQVSEGTVMTSHSLWLHDHSFFFNACTFPLHIWTSLWAYFFFLLGLFFPEMCLFSTTPTLKATCPCTLLNSFTIFLPTLCLALPDNLFYSRQSPSPLQLSLLILLHRRASFSLPPPLESRAGNISVNGDILYEWWNDRSIQCIQTDMP